MVYVGVATLPLMQELFQVVHYFTMEASFFKPKRYFGTQTKDFN